MLDHPLYRLSHHLWQRHLIWQNAIHLVFDVHSTILLVCSLKSYQKHVGIYKHIACYSLHLILYWEALWYLCFEFIKLWRLFPCYFRASNKSFYLLFNDLPNPETWWNGRKTCTFKVKRQTFSHNKYRNKYCDIDSWFDKKKQESHCKPKKQTVETIHAHLQ